jgi:uncharacterized iron-regulated membrane protein
MVSGQAGVGGVNGYSWMSAWRRVRLWSQIHRWSSLICMLFLLLLCLTGLPLIFHDEIDNLLGDTPRVADVPAGTPRVGIDKAVEIARARVPGDAVQFIVPDREDPVWRVTLGPTSSSRNFDAIVHIDAHTGKILRVAKTYGGAFTNWILQLHTNLFADQTGAFFLCFIGLMFLASIVSGVVVYAPFMRRLTFGTIRKRQRPRVKWLDLHNFLGIVITAWMLVVGVTGTINTLATQIARHWQRTELADMIAPWRGQPVPAHVVSPQTAFEAALPYAPDMTLSSIAVPGNPFAGPHHYAIFFHGKTPLTARILKPVLIDAETGKLTATRDLPWYAKALFVSQPLHFGDYGGLPLKILWALLDAVTIVVLASGIYLWVTRLGSRRDSDDAIIAGGARRALKSSSV